MRTIRLIIIALLVFNACTRNQRVQESRPFANLPLQRYSSHQLESDFDLLVNALKEAHTGLYWYSSKEQFDSVVAQQRVKLMDSLNALQFYTIVAPIVAFTKEDHCDISLPTEINEILSEKGFFLPLSVINLNRKIYLLNSPVPEKNIKGAELLAVNDVDINIIRQQLFNTFAADGFITTSKYRYLDFRGFSREFAKVIGQQKENSITVRNRQTGKKETYVVASVTGNELTALNEKVMRENSIRKEIDKPAQLQFTDDNIPVLSFRTFSNRAFKRRNMDFKKFVDSSFVALSQRSTKDLIIDMRDNGGGSEGNEDYLFSYLIDKPYHKYKSVAVSAITFTFLDNTDYANEEDKRELEEELKEENEQASDGKYYRKPDLYVPAEIKKNGFRGKVYILTSGWTYSGGAEFSSLMREHTDAVFIGEETGGGFYGNTSGTSLELTLPNTKLVIDIPILKFALDVKKGTVGRGVIPDYEVQPSFDEFLVGDDVEMKYALGLIQNDR